MLATYLKYSIAGEIRLRVIVSFTVELGTNLIIIEVGKGDEDGYDTDEREVKPEKGDIEDDIGDSDEWDCTDEDGDDNKE